MPEAPVDKDGQLRRPKDEIRTPRQIGAVHHPASNTTLHKVSSKALFGGPSVTRPDESHDSRAGLGSDAIHQMRERIRVEEFSCRSIIRSPKYVKVQKSEQKPIAIDFFCGAGGFSLGFHQAGFAIAAAFDLDPIHVATYSKNFPATEVTTADVSTLSADHVRRSACISATRGIDVVYGGPPCQGFSLIGRRNADDPRNRLLSEFARLVGELQPRYFVIENVAGLLMGEPRKLLAKTLKTLRLVGYRWVSPIRILDAYDYGVPQKRRRVIVLGYRKGEVSPKYPKKIPHKISVGQAIGDLYAIGRRRSLFKSDRFVGKLGATNTYLKLLRSPGKRKIILTGCQLCQHRPEVIARFKETRGGEAEPISRFVRLALKSAAPTLRAGTGKDKGSYTAPRPIHPTQPRCITVREAARLHSFPDWFQFNNTQWHGFRQVGNAVPPMLARAIATSIAEALNAKA